jgi:hypothetical protein
LTDQLRCLVVVLVLDLERHRLKGVCVRKNGERRKPLRLRPPTREEAENDDEKEND